MTKERKKFLNDLIKIVKNEKDKVYVVAHNRFSSEELKYLEKHDVIYNFVRYNRDGLIGDYTVQEIYTRLEYIG